MNKKILIGSIIAVVILVLVSFTGVVGYQTTKSSTNAKASPLFSIRSSRAIDKESKDLTCDYVGKGEDNFLSIPKRDNKIELIQKFIDSIRTMDDKTFYRFLDVLFKRFNQEHIIKKNTVPKLIVTLHQLKTNPNNIKNYITDITDKSRTENFFYCTSVDGEWYPGCILWAAFAYIIVVIGAILWLIGMKRTWIAC